MKKIISICILLSLCLLLFSSCSDSNIDSNVIGTWQSRNFSKSTYIFKSNGKFERNTPDNKYYEGSYTAIDGILTLDYGEDYEKQEIEYKYNGNKSDVYYGELKIGLEYFESLCPT